MNYDDKTTDELLELIPNNLHLARNSDAPDRDRFRMFNSANGKYIEPGAKTGRRAIIKMLEKIDIQRKEWLSV